MRFVAGAFCFTLAMVIAAVEALSDDDLDVELAQTSPIQSPREVQGQAASSTGSSGVKPCEELPQTASSSSGVKRTFSGRPTSNQTLFSSSSKIENCPDRAVRLQLLPPVLKEGKTKLFRKICPCH